MLFIFIGNLKLPLFLLYFIVLWGLQCCFKIMLKSLSKPTGYPSVLSYRVSALTFPQVGRVVFLPKWNSGFQIRGKTKLRVCFTGVCLERLGRAFWMVEQGLLLEMWMLKTSKVQTLRGFHNLYGIYWPKKQWNTVFHEMAIYVVPYVYLTVA